MNTELAYKWRVQVGESDVVFQMTTSFEVRQGDFVLYAGQMYMVIHRVFSDALDAMLVVTPSAPRWPKERRNERATGDTLAGEG